MIAKKLFQTTLLKSLSTPITKMTFSDNKWKERQQSSEKVFISSQEKKTLSKLLDKLEIEENSGARHSEFEQRLKGIVSQHKIQNSAAFIAEIINLHRSL